MEVRVTHVGIDHYISVNTSVTYDIGTGWLYLREI